MKVVLASDHRGYQLKETIKQLLRDLQLPFLDVGTFTQNSVDYPDFAVPAAEKVSRGEYDRGILICGSGVGMCVVANKFPGIRAALVRDVYTAEMSRKHNDSNVLALGADLVSAPLACEMVERWIETQFEGGRHLRRIEKITALEERLRDSSGEPHT
jgi:ribose 5-phosphate isomerase B